MLITGNRGYIGSHLDLEASGCDLKDGQDYRDLTGSWGTVIHLAASVSVTESFKYPRTYMENNADGVQEFLARNKVERIVFISTGGAMYGNRILAQEDDAALSHCLSPYARSKFIAEQFVRQHPNHCILRLANVYGGDTAIRGEAAVHQHFQNDDPIVLYGGDQTRDFVTVDVVANAIKKAAAGSMVGTFNIGSGAQTKVADWAYYYAGFRRVEVVLLPPRSGEVEHISLDCTRAKDAGLLD